MIGFRTERKFLICLSILFAIISNSTAQSVTPLWQQIDSIAKQDGIERHFAGVYVLATRAADDYIATLPDTPKVLMTRLQLNFASLFKKGIADAESGNNNEVWHRYFHEKSLTPMQYKLVGTNDHINGDSWKVLTSVFTRDELDIVAPYYHHCTIELYSVLDSLHNYAMANSKRMKFLHHISLGADKGIARKMLSR